MLSVRRKQLIGGLFFILVFISLVTSASEELGTFKQNDCIRLIQVCSNCTQTNITSITFPNGTLALSEEVQMTKTNTLYNYTFCNTTTNGKYLVTGVGDLDGINSIWSYTFDVTSDGTEGFSTSQSIASFSGFIIFILLTTFFFVLGLILKGHPAFPTISFSIAVFFLFVSSLYSMVLIEKALGNYPALVESFASYIFILKIALSIGILFLILYAGYLAFKSWNFKRGFED